MTALNFSLKRRCLGGPESSKIVYGGPNSAATFGFVNGPGVGELLIESGVVIWNGALCMVSPWKSVDPVAAAVDAVGSTNVAGTAALFGGSGTLINLIIGLGGTYYTILTADVTTPAQFLLALAAAFSGYSFNYGGANGGQLVITKTSAITINTSTSSTANTLLGLTAATYSTNTRDVVVVDTGRAPGSPPSITGDGSTTYVAGNKGTFEFPVSATNPLTSPVGSTAMPGGNGAQGLAYGEDSNLVGGVASTFPIAGRLVESNTANGTVFIDLNQRA